MTLAKRSSSKRCPDKVKQAHLAQLQQYRPTNFISMVRTDESWPSNKTEVAGVELSATASSFRCSSQAFTYPRKRWWHSTVLLVWEHLSTACSKIYCGAQACRAKKLPRGHKNIHSFQVKLHFRQPPREACRV